MATTTKQASQQFVPIREVRDGIAILKDGRMCSVLLASSINFALKSQDEQRAVLLQFQNFLNTLDFSLQIYVQSRELDIRPYLELLSTRESSQDNDLMRVQLREYIEFVRTFTEEVDIMTKSFFAVIPYAPAHVNIKSGIAGVFGGSRETEAVHVARFEEDRSQIEQRISVVEQGLNRIGIHTAALTTDEIIELFYHIFNPGDSSQPASEERV